MREFRKVNPRIDYYPTEQAVSAMERFRKIYPKFTTREVLDALVVAGIKAFTSQAKAAP